MKILSVRQPWASLIVSDVKDVENPHLANEVSRPRSHPPRFWLSSPARCRGQKRGSDQAIGRSRGGLSTKIHMAVRGLGCPVRFTLTAGQKGDAP